MIKEFEKLTTQEQALLYKTPVLMSVLVSCANSEVDETMKSDAIKLVHLRSFAAPHLLIPYYQEVEKNFKGEFEEAVKDYFPFDEENRKKLKGELNKSNKIIAKLDEGYAHLLHKSLESYAKHVKRSVHSVFQDFIFPLTYSKLND